MRELRRSYQKLRRTEVNVFGMCVEEQSSINIDDDDDVNARPLKPLWPSLIDSIPV